MKVLVKVHGLQLVVPCGDGRQTCRWLSLAVAQRYALAAPHGRCRTREDAHLRRGFFLPAGVAKANGQVLAPDKQIGEVCKDGEVLTVTLQQEVPVNELGAPQFHPWTLKAFFPSSLKQFTTTSAKRMSSTGIVSADAKHINDFGSSEAKHEDAKSEKGQPADAKRTEPNLEDDMKEYARCEILQQVASGQFLSEMEAEAAFMFDWGRMRTDDALGDPSGKAKDSIRDVLLAQFSQLNAAYRHYATGSSETGYGMTGPEFAHLCHECGLAELTSPSDQQGIDKALGKTLRLHDPALVSPADGGATLSRAGFLHALVRVLVGASGVANVRDAVEQKLQQHVVPAVARLTSGPVRDLTHDDRVIAGVLSAKPKLLKLYTRYAQEFPVSPVPSSTQGETPTWPALLSAAALKSLLYDCGMFCSGPPTSHDLVFRSAVEQSVAAARELTLPEDQGVVFVEMIEVTARVALAMLSSGVSKGDVDAPEHELPPVDAIRLALEAVRSLPVKLPTPPPLRK